MRPLLSKVKMNTGNPIHCTPPFLPEKFPKNSIMRVRGILARREQAPQEAKKFLMPVLCTQGASHKSVQ